MSMIGKSLAHYSITAEIGKGGMGEVYQAKDNKLGRDVAIKVLPEEFAKDADRIARFQREAKLLAFLNHQNIAAIYGLEKSDDTHFLVLELVEGNTLADRIKAGAIPVEEALKLALQIAEALEAAHEKGVIHRDLKPANIKVTSEGKVKVLDFGLAKAYAGEQDQMNLSNSPTLSDMATQHGVILGTASYMPPEQAKGKSVDKRADVWAFGVVLFEMLSGRQLFTGETVSETLAAVMKSEVNLDLLPKKIHPRIREVLIRCLQKEQKSRYSGISDARYEIEQVLSDPSGVLVQPITIADPRARLRTILPWTIAAFVLGALITGIVIWVFYSTSPKSLITLFSVDLAGEPGPTVALSPDGSRFVYSANNQLYIHSLDQMAPTPIPGTEGGSQPFFSPDGESVAFFTSTHLKTVTLTGGSPIVLAEVGAGTGVVGTWDSRSRIFFGQSGTFGLSQVPASGGTPETFAALGDHSDFDYPEVLPGGEWVLFTDVPVRGKWSNANIVAQSIKTGERKLILKNGHFARYVPTGHLIYAQNGTLFAIGFDADRLEITGKAVPVVQDIATNEASGHAGYSVSNNGTLIYLQETGYVPAKRTLVWVDRNGKEDPIAAVPDTYSSPRISPDGTRLALTVGNGEDADIWIWDLVRKALTRFTFEKGQDSSPLWFPDSKRIVFYSGRNNEPGLYWKMADGTGNVDKIGSTIGSCRSLCWSGDLDTVVFGGISSRSFDISALSMKADHALEPLLEDEFIKGTPCISTDGKWIAYMSLESGQAEIYVRPFPDVNSGIWQISASGGQEPRWSHNNHELFYRNGDAMMVVPIETEPTIKAGAPETLFRESFYSGWGHDWDIHPDGDRFLMIKPAEPTEDDASQKRPHEIIVVLNWFEYLKERVPVDY